MKKATDNVRSKRNRPPFTLKNQGAENFALYLDNETNRFSQYSDNAVNSFGKYPYTWSEVVKNDKLALPTPDEVF